MTPRLTPVVFVVLAACAACQDPDVPKYVQNPGGPTIQIPTAIRLSVLQGIGADAQHAYVTASLRDQQGRGIADTLLAFSTSKGTIEPRIAKTNVSGEAKTTVTNGTDVTISVSGAGLTASMDVAIAAPLSVSLSASRAEKNVPVTLTANVNSDASPPLHFVWNFGDGQIAQTEVGKVTHTWAEDGPVKVEVSVTDAIDRRGTTSLSITVRDNPEPPPPPETGPTPQPGVTVTLSVTPAQPIVNQPATLTATATSTNGAPPVTGFDWDCTNDGAIDGMTAGNAFQCTYAAGGTQTARAVAHAGMITGTGTLAITVLADAPFFVAMSSVPPPPAITIGDSITFTATVTSTGLLPNPLVWEWDDDGNGTTDFVVTATGPSNSRSLVATTTGAKTVKIRVRHPATSREALGTITVTVNP